MISVSQARNLQKFLECIVKLAPFAHSRTAYESSGKKERNVHLINNLKCQWKIYCMRLPGAIFDLDKYVDL